MCVCVRVYAESWTTKRYAIQKKTRVATQSLSEGDLRHHQSQAPCRTLQIRESFGMKELVEEMIVQWRLRWLGHVSRMDQSRMPKQLLFSRLRKTRPFHGVKMRWTRLVFRCANCSRSFSRSGDMKRHKCDSVRSRKVVAQNSDAAPTC